MYVALNPRLHHYVITTIVVQDSGGDLEITVTSDDEEIVSGVREAAHTVFGKAWVK